MELEAVSQRLTQTNTGGKQVMRSLAFLTSQEKCKSKAMSDEHSSPLQVRPGTVWPA